MNVEHNLILSPGKALVVVAHPDDETIWMGGTILAFPNTQWTIISLCRADDNDRAPKFKRVLKHYRVRGAISDLEDDALMTIRESVPEIQKRLSPYVRGKHFDYLFTHAYNGEYGHARHKGVHRAVTLLARSGTLAVKEHFVFSYELHRSGKLTRPSKTGTHTLSLPSKIYKEKLHIIHDLYGFSKDSFEYRSSHPKETFREMKVR